MEKNIITLIHYFSKKVKDFKILFKEEIIWKNVIGLCFIHASALAGGFQFFTFQYKWQSYIWFVFFTIFAGLGITAGAHRYWTHRSFQAKLPLRIILCIMQSAALQTPIYEWVRDHRAHHKFTETDADPHNSKRGFFFAHCGWLMRRKHEQVKIKGGQIDLSDLRADSVVMFQKKYYFPWIIAVSFIIQMIIPMYFWGESFWFTYFFTQWRYCTSLNGTWCVNSASHLWGDKPYDKSINPVENMLVSFFVLGEGWHNFHHVFPWDYRTSEFGFLNLTKYFIEFFAHPKIRWAYNLKSVANRTITERSERTGSSTRTVLFSGNGKWSWPKYDK